MEEMQGTTKILGMPWEVEKDLILHAVPEEKDLNQRSLTKRGLLRLVASIFSPLGLATPMVVKAKIRIGRLHSMGLGWDEDLELRVQTATTQKARQAYQEEVDFWRKWIDLVPAMCSTPFPRCIRPRGGEVIRTELHMFGDASEEAFAAAVYIRNIYLDGEITMTVVMAKSRLGPKKVISVAKMELQAALLGTRLARTVEGALRFKVDRRIFWTDSAVTRHWIRSTANFYKSFVACRVGEIQALTQPTEWRHIPGKLNVADLATRSAITEENEENPLPREWIEGKDFLHQTDESAWPKDLDFEHTGEEVRPNWEFMTMHAKTTFAEDLVDLTKVSRYLHLQRVIARVVAVFQKKKLTAMLERPNRECLQLAEKVLVRDAQKEFIEEMESYRNEKKIKRSSRLVSLTPYVDADGLLRVGGRFGKTRLPYSAKHPVILSSRHRLTQILAEYYHKIYLHGGYAHILGQMRQKYWVIGGRSLLKKIGSRCFECRRQNAPRLTQLMGDLPVERTIPCPAFARTSVDYFGPVTIRTGYKSTDKRWVALFACMVTRAVHLELAASMSTADFLVAFRTFVNLRGEPQYLYSDNGSNFVGAVKYLCDKGSSMQWKFYPPEAPHFGGLHERLVRSAKSAIMKATEAAMKRRNFTESEYRCLLAEVMGFLNARPLTYLSDDPDDEVLTPNHFLLQRAGASLPESALTATKYKDNYEFVQSTANDIWKIWQTEFLPPLITRAKWRNQQRNLKIDDVVLLADDNLKRNHWRVGRIVATYPDVKGNVRSVRVRIRGDPVVEYDRPAVRCCLLEETPTLDA
jgi:hypothetical protein